MFEWPSPIRSGTSSPEPEPLRVEVRPERLEHEQRGVLLRRRLLRGFDDVRHAVGQSR